MKHIGKRSVDEDLKDAEKLLKMLADYRVSDRNEWMTVGWILYNIGEGCQKALDLWIDFSRKCGEKFNESVCTYDWNMMVKKRPYFRNT